MNMIEALEIKLNKKSKKNFLPMQIGDVQRNSSRHKSFKGINLILSSDFNRRRG